MKQIIVQYPDAAVITIPKGTKVTVTDGTNALPDGQVVGMVDMLDPDVVQHTHPAAIGPAVEG